MARALERRGHQCALVTGRSLESEARKAEIERIPRGDKDGESFEVPLWMNPLSVAMQILHVEYAVKRFQPDVLVGQQLTLGPMIASRRNDLPLAIIGLMTYPYPYLRGDEALSPEYKHRLSWRHGDVLQTLNEARATFSLAPESAQPHSSPLLGDLFLLRSLPALEVNPQGLPEHVHMVGDLLWHPPIEGDSELEDWLGAIRERRCVYVQHGRVFGLPGFWKEFVQAMRKSGLTAAVAASRMDFDLGDYPQDFLVRPHLPQHLVLARSRTVVSSANTTVTLGALRAGVPSLQIPSGSEQPDVAECCRRRGLSLTLADDQLNPQGLKEALHRLGREPRFQEACQSMSREMSAYQGRRKAVRLLEGLAGDRARAEVASPWTAARASAE